MMELITTYNSAMSEYTNAMTDEMDSLMMDNLKPYIEYGGTTYLYGHVNDGSLSLRFPGATRGGISFDKNGIITEVILYDDEVARDNQCYKPEAYEAIKKYVGAKLIFINEKGRRYNEGS
jgi:hypothetical protein